MRKYLASVLVLAVVAAAAATSATAACTTTPFSATFAEPFGGPHGSGAPAANCPEPYFSCGHGALAGQQVTEGIQHVDVAPAGDSPGDYDLRTITFPDGSTVVLKETLLFETTYGTPGNSGSTPACCGSHSYGNPAQAQLQEEIIGGTGRFAGITGAATGTFNVAGGVVIIRISGIVTFGC